MYNDISPAVEKNKGLDYTIKSFLAKFFIKDKGSVADLTSNYTKASHKRKKPENRKYIYIYIYLKIKIDSFNDATLKLSGHGNNFYVMATKREICCKCQ